MADFQQYYQLDVQTLIDSYEFERLFFLTVNLPKDSRTVCDADPRNAWSNGDYLLALAVDNLSYLRYEQAGGKGRKPDAVKRPELKTKTHKKLNVSEKRVDELLFDSR